MLPADLAARLEAAGHPRDAEGVLPGVYGQAKDLPHCQARTRDGGHCWRYGRIRLPNGRLVCTQHAKVAAKEAQRR